MTPGDNDWTDCHLLKQRNVDPMERLATLREMFYPAGRSLGKRVMPVESQASDPKFPKFRENLAWTLNNVTFMTMHIVGSNNNRGRTPEMNAETNERMAANVAWLKKAFADAKARNSAGLVLMTQANPGFETHWTPSLIDRFFRLFPGIIPPKELPPSGFDDILNAIAVEMESYDKPTLFIHGDTHIFHVSKPLVSKKTGRFVDHFTRLEVFGDPDSYWVVSWSIRQTLGCSPFGPRSFRRTEADNVSHRGKFNLAYAKKLRRSALRLQISRARRDQTVTAAWI